MDNIESSIAIIGMAGRFPGAKNIDEFWQNLTEGKESITFFSEAELLEAGIDPELLQQPNYVKAKGALDDVAGFDANLFDFTPKEASITDPQQRLFLECAWEALENAGYDTSNYDGAVGVYGGIGGFDTYLLKNLVNNAELMETVGNYQVTLSNDKDFLCTRTAYKLNLTGPAVTVQTACSTSLVAVIQACQSLLHYQCDMALAGGACVTLSNKSGYLYQEGMIMSPDGHCRSFDANSQGIVDGNGAGIVVLKRLEEALEDKDHIYAVIRGSHINNDGSSKMSYTSPSVQGQSKVVKEALAMAEIDPETITYVEAHGTGTALGDPIEIAALNQAYNTNKTGYCAIGSVKTNVGHLDVAAGVTGLIKATLALKHQQIPPSLHFESPNPEIDFANSPFYVNTKLIDWQPDGIPRRAGVSSFGIGGTNAHVVLEEAPSTLSVAKSRPTQLLPLSAKTDSALEASTNQLIEHLQLHPDLNLADVAYTYQIGRRAFEQRGMLIGNNIEEITSCQPITAIANTMNSVVFMFSGQGSQYVNMGLELYQTETVFREQVDYCCQVLQPHLGVDLRSVLYPVNTDEDLNQTVFSQPALFVVEYALAKLWMSWGISPSAMIGHSIGEYVAACLAGVFTLDEALPLVAVRGRLMQSMPHGSMLAVPLAEAELRPLLNDNIDLAVINVTSQCVVSGDEEVIEQFSAQLLAEQGLECRTLHTSHAFHSAMMEPILPTFLEQIQKINLQSPQIPYLSNVTGTWVKHEEATDPNYWVNHLRQTVRFADGLQELVTKPKYILLEVGPGRTLSTFAKRHPDKVAGKVVLTSLRHPNDELSDSSFVIKTLGQLWLNGITVNWADFYGDEQRRRLPLPSYPFERQKYWIEPQPVSYSKAITAEQRWDALVEVAIRQAQKDIDKFDNYPEKTESLERLGVAYVNLTLQTLNAFNNEQQYSEEEFFEQFNIQPAYQQMLPRCLEKLVNHGNLQEANGIFTNFQPFSKNSINTLLEEVRNKWIDEPEWVELVKCCGENYADILTGKIEPRELLYTGNIFDILQSLYKNAPESRYFNTIIQMSMREIVTTLSPNAHLRILEIGAGTGSTTSYILPELSPQQTTYTFTDIGPTFLEQAKHKFTDYSFIQYHRLDIGKSVVEQDFAEHNFDVIIANNVLHAAPNLEKTLQNVSTLLASEGILLLLEPTTPSTIQFDIVFSFMDPFEPDTLRSRYPFLTAEQWQHALQQYGFSEIIAIPEKKILDDQVLIAKLSKQTSSEVSLAFTEIRSSYEIQSSNNSHTNSVVDKNYTHPSNDAEQKIAGVWQKFIGINKISVHDDFFELGGDSLVAVQLMSKLRDIFSVSLAPHHLIEAPTISKLALLIDKIIVTPQQKGSYRLVKIQHGSPSKFPLFCIHPAGGHIFYYRNLARYFDSEQPIYGIQEPPENFEEHGEYSSFAEKAVYYISVIKTVQPKGPYLLSGMSYGGNMAYEMAKQLKQQGEEIALVAMFDSYPPTSYEHQPQEDSNFLIPFLMLVEVLMGGNEVQRAPTDVTKNANVEEQWNYVLNRVNELIPDMKRQDIINLFKTWKNHHGDLKCQIMQIYSDPVLFFQATEPLPNNLGQLLNQNVEAEFVASEWRKFLPEMVYIQTPGDHLTLIEEPNVSTLVENMKVAIRKYFLSKIT